MYANDTRFFFMDLKWFKGPVKPISYLWFTREWLCQSFNHWFLPSNIFMDSELDDQFNQFNQFNQFKQHFSTSSNSSTPMFHSSTTIFMVPSTMFHCELCLTHPATHTRISTARPQRHAAAAAVTTSRRWGPRRLRFIGVLGTSQTQNIVIFMD